MIMSVYLARVTHGVESEASVPCQIIIIGIGSVHLYGVNPGGVIPIMFAFERTAASPDAVKAARTVRTRDKRIICEDVIW